MAGVNMIDSIFKGEGDCEQVKTGEGELDFKTKYPFTRKDFVSSSSFIDVKLCETIDDTERWAKRLKTSKPITSVEQAALQKHLAEVADLLNESHRHLCFWDEMEGDNVLLAEGTEE